MERSEMRDSLSAAMGPLRSRSRISLRFAHPAARRFSMTKVCDYFPELKEVTEARERRYREHPEKRAPEGPQSFVEVKVTSIGQLNELVECKRSGFKFIISEPVHVGGQNVAPSPLEFLLSGAVGCYAAVFAFYAAKMGVTYD